MAVDLDGKIFGLDYFVRGGRVGEICQRVVVAFCLCTALDGEGLESLTSERVFEVEKE